MTQELTSLISDCEEVVKKTQWEIKRIKPQYKTIICHLENMVKIVSLQKLVYTNILNNKNLELLPKMATKFDELLAESYDILSDLVKEGIRTEGYYLEYCEWTKKEREVLWINCRNFGVKPTLKCDYTIGDYTMTMSLVSVEFPVN